MHLNVCLPFPALPPELSLLQAGRLYWLACDTPDDATLLAGQLLGGLSAWPAVGLIGAGIPVADVTSYMVEHEGPGSVALYELPLAALSRQLQAIQADLPHIAAKAGRFLLAVVAVPAPDAGTLVDCCARLQTSLRQEGTTLLVVSAGSAAALMSTLLRENWTLAGLARLFRDGEYGRLQHQFWCNELGCQGPHERLLEWGAAGFRLLPDPTAQLADATDYRCYLAMVDVLQGQPPPSADWELFDSHAGLLRRAATARAATVVLTLQSRAQVQALATLARHLRLRCGQYLKLVVCERSPGLRHQDVLTLLAHGVNLLLPAGLPLSHLLVQLQGIRRQRWSLPLPPAAPRLMEGLRPADFSGIVSPAVFACAVSDMLERADHSGIEHQLLRLVPLPGLEAAQVQQQLRLRRAGDLACCADGRLYLFLFACPTAALDAALDRICFLPWRELLDRVVEADVATLQLPQFRQSAAGADPALPLSDAVPTTVPQGEASSKRPPLQPQRLVPAPAETSA